MLVIQSRQTLCNPMDVAHQAPLSIGFSRQEYWSGLPFPPPRGLSDPGIKSISPALAGRFFFFFLPSEPSGKTMKMSLFIKNHWEGFSCVKKRHHLQIPLTKICQKVFSPWTLHVSRTRLHECGVRCDMCPDTINSLFIFLNGLRRDAEESPEWPAKFSFFTWWYFHWVCLPFPLAPKL